MDFGDQTRSLAIFLAILAAVSLSLGAQFQNDAVTKAQGATVTRGGLSLRTLTGLLRRPRWLAGTAFLGLAIALQLGALALAPLIVVQPVGAIALVLTASLNSRIYKVALNKVTWFAVFLTIAGVAGFVSFAASNAVEQEMGDEKLLVVVGILFVLILGFATLFYLSKGHVGPLNYIFGAGVLYGFVASLAKVVLLRLSQGYLDWLTLLAAAALIAATVLGGWFVQNAYASGPPDLVIAGLTVIDPAVAILIAIVILGEASEASGFVVAGFTVSGIVAGVGVYLLSKFHPQLSERE